MTQEITAEQAAHIFDLESYKAVTGYKRLKRTDEEMNLGLSPEDALKRRLAAIIAPAQVQMPNVAFDTDFAMRTVSAIAERRKEYDGEIIIRIRPAVGVDRDYFEHLPKGEVTVHLDNQAYGWLDVKLGGQYQNETPEFFRDLLNEGLGELIDHPKFTQPKESHVYDNSDQTPSEPQTSS
jgi:hypothetical protein